MKKVCGRCGRGWGVKGLGKGPGGEGAGEGGQGRGGGRQEGLKSVKVVCSKVLGGDEPVSALLLRTKTPGGCSPPLWSAEACAAQMPSRPSSTRAHGAALPTVPPPPRSCPKTARAAALCRLAQPLSPHAAHLRMLFTLPLPSPQLPKDRSGGGGAILVFLPGAPEISRAARTLREWPALAHAAGGLHKLRILPLHGSLSAHDQSAVFARCVREGGGVCGKKGSSALPHRQSAVFARCALVWGRAVTGPWPCPAAARLAVGARPVRRLCQVRGSGKPGPAPDCCLCQVRSRRRPPMHFHSATPQACRPYHTPHPPSPPPPVLWS